VIRLEKVPNGIKEIKEWYGDPDPEGDGVYNTEFSENLKTFTLPFALEISWKPGHLTKRVYGHVKVMPAFTDAMEEFRDRVGIGEIRERGWDVWGGCWNFRPARGYESLSTHAWGIAVDLNPHLAPLGKPSRQPQILVDIMKARGFVYGGEFARVDGMHFQACGGF